MIDLQEVDEQHDEWIEKHYQEVYGDE